MKLLYDGKKMEQEIFNSPIENIFNTKINVNNNILIKGDNFFALQLLLQEKELKNKIDLIYIDPPFATNSNFFVGKDRTSTISSSRTDSLAYTDTLTGYKYLEFLRERLILARELLSDKGSIYVHCDYKEGHYLKIIMDEVFGRENFRNDITRIKCNPKNFSRKAFGNIKDMILFYSKTNNVIWNDPVEEYTTEDIKRLFKKTNKEGRLYTTIPLHAPGETKNGVTGGPFKGVYPPKGRHWRSDPKKLEKLDELGLIEWSSSGNPRKIIFADEKKGKKKQDIWEYKDNQYPLYPTEKNSLLLKDIVSFSSNEESIVLDFFCGSGTSLVAAQELGRRWIGVDMSEEAIHITKKRLANVDNLLFSSCSYDYVVIESLNPNNTKVC